MTRDEAIENVCAIVALTYRTIGDYTHSSDGFCLRCRERQTPLWNYSNDGYAIEYIRQAVLKSLKADGYTIARGFSTETGKEIKE